MAIDGTAGNDTLNGTVGDDTINGFSGDDTINGLAGNDTIDGGDGDDTIDGGDGNDIIYGGIGQDFIHGGNGDDIIHAGPNGNYPSPQAPAPEYIWDGPGNDTVYGDDGPDVIFGSAGNDYYDGGPSPSGIQGDEVDYSGASAGIVADMRLTTNQVHSSGTADAANIGVDTLVSIEVIGGSAFDDVMTAGATAMAFLGGSGNDNLTGGAGDDFLRGDAGVDTLTGGAGRDTFEDTPAGLNGDTITDFHAGDAIIFDGANLGSFTFSLSGHTLTYSGGSLTLGLVPGNIVARDVGGAVELVVRHQVANDFNGDGRSDMLWRNDNGQLVDWLGTASGTFNGNGPHSSSTVAADWQVAGTGDFNGDGRSDILWRSTSTGAIADWLGTASGGFAGNGANSTNAVAASWHVAGVGDFNGDGRSDILWMNDSGQLVDWLGTANGGLAGNGANSKTSVTAGWHVVGIGDFNGDGFSDILWQNGSRVVDWLGTQTGGFTGNGANSSNTISASWQVAGIGDFNGDGHSDILWRNGTTGEITDWLGTDNGGFTDNSAVASTILSTDWQVAAIGDYNGNGVDDILWRNTIRGEVTDWLGHPIGGFTDNSAHAATTVDSHWHVQPDQNAFV